MRGVPSLMRPRMTSSLPPAVSLGNRGPRVAALMWGGRWQIPQDWAKTCRPNFCVAVNPSSVAACCADASPAASTPKSSTPKRTTKRPAERIAALRFILNPPDIFFCKPTPAQCRAEGLDPEPGGLTGMRSGGASATICGWATRATGRRSVMPTQPFQKDGSLIELAQGIGADTLSIVCTGAHVRRRVKQSLKMERPNVAATCSCLRDPNSHGLKPPLPPATLAARRENTHPARGYQGGGCLEPRRQGRCLRLCCRHARGRSGDQHIGAGSLGPNSPGFPQYQVDCAIGGREPARLCAAHRLRQRPAPLRAHGGQGTGGAVEQAALSTAHDDRGPAPV